MSLRHTTLRHLKNMIRQLEETQGANDETEVVIGSIPSGPLPEEDHYYSIDKFEVDYNGIMVLQIGERVTYE